MIVSVLLVVVLPGTLCGTICWIAYLIHANDQDHLVRLRFFPRLIPWTAQAKLRKKKVELETTNVERDILDAKHARLQKELVLSELEEKQYQRALGKAEEKK